MGRPFREELAELESTHRWASNASVVSLVEKIQRLCPLPLFAVGSGGSLTTATVAATLFRDFTFGIGVPITPQELAANRGTLRRTSVLIATAGGSNPDAIGALKTAAQSDASEVLAICTRVGSKLSVEATKFSNVSIEEIDLPTNGDGFLATNSLWASAVLLTRAFAIIGHIPIALPERLPRLVGATRWDAFVDSVGKQAAPLWERETVIVLYDAASYPAAVDLESKLTEAALSNVWISDYRHFAHGRHHWIAKRRNQTSVIAFLSETDSQLANRTLNEIPDDVPRIKIELPNGPLAMLIALAHVFPLTASAGKAKAIDPGRPGVPSFGRRIYRLNAYGKISPKQNVKPSLQTTAIERKTNIPIGGLVHRGKYLEWKHAYSQFIKRLQETQFRAIVFDYDGTLCDSTERFTGLRPAVSSELERLLDAGLCLGIATGRGKSVRKSLRESIPAKYWGGVTVGYYNGGQIGLLNDDVYPDGRAKVAESLVPVWNALKVNRRVNEIAEIEGRLTQITVSATETQDADECWQIVCHLAAIASAGTIKTVRSSHSFDLIPANVSKIGVVKLLQDTNAEVLTVGDMGRWPGNDYELLNHEFSLSVDKVSPAPATCWNIASAGIRGVEATLEYLGRMQVDKKGRARFKLLKQVQGEAK